MNCAENIQDRPGQPAYEMFGIKDVDFNGVRFDPLGSRSLPYERIKFGSSSVKTVADKHRLDAYHNKHC